MTLIMPQVYLQILMNVRETMMAVVKSVATPLAHTSAVAIVDMSSKGMLEDAKVWKFVSE